MERRAHAFCFHVRQPSRRSRSRDHDHANVGSKPSYRSRKNHGDTRDCTREEKLSRHAENRHDGDGSPSRDGSLEREMYKERRYAKDTLHRDSRRSEHSPGHGVIRKRIHGRYSDDDSPDGDDYGRRETGNKGKARRETNSEIQEQMDDEKDRKPHRSSRKYSREGSSADQEESHEDDTVRDKSQRERWKHGHERSSSRYSHEEGSTESRHHQHRGSDLGVNGENDRKRSVETSPVEYQSDKDRDKSKQRHRYKTRDGDSDRSRKGKRLIGLSSEESSDRETRKERPHRHRKRRRSQNSHDQARKLAEDREEVEEEIERWRPA